MDIRNYHISKNYKNNEKNYLGMFLVNFYCIGKTYSQKMINFASTNIIYLNVKDFSAIDAIVKSRSQIQFKNVEILCYDFYFNAMALNLIFFGKLFFNFLWEPVQKDSYGILLVPAWLAMDAVEAIGEGWVLAWIVVKALDMLTGRTLGLGL